MAIICLAKTVSMKQFKPPNRRQVGGELLKANYEAVAEANTVALLSEASMFGLTFSARLPLSRNYGSLMSSLCLSIPRRWYSQSITAVGIWQVDVGRMLRILRVSSIPTSTKWIPRRRRQKSFFYRGVSNVQKAGELIVARLPGARCVYRGEHMISLFRQHFQIEAS